LSATTNQIQIVELFTASPDLGADGVVMVRLRAGELSGVGEICSASMDELEPAAEELAIQVLGRGVLDREAAWQAICGAASDWDGPADSIAAVLAGIDTAMWDLGATALGLPVYALMGGRLRRSLEVCLDVGPVCADAVDTARQAYSKGVRSFSFDVDPDDEADIRHMKAARKQLGAEALLIARSKGPSGDAQQATLRGAALDRLDPYWVEGLLEDGQWRELADLRRSIASATGAGAATIGLKKFWRALEAGCADVLTPALAFVGGPTGAIRLVAAAQMRGVRLAIGPGETAVSALAAAHVSFARADVYPLRVSPAVFSALEALPGVVENGFLRLPDVPGLGLQPISSVESLLTFAGQEEPTA